MIILATLDKRATPIAAILLALVSLAYFATAIWFAAHSPLWMDEVLAVWTARMPTAAGVWRALEKGAEFSPPLYHLLLQKIIQLGGAGTLAMRAPSILAGYVAATAVGVLIRRRANFPIAALAMSLILVGGLYLFAIQARPYALVTACIACALLVWDGPAEARDSPVRAAGLALLLALAVGLHFYAVLLVGGFAAMEVLRARVYGRIRWLSVAAILLAGASILIWLPIARAAGRFNPDDVAALGYYARPTLVGLLRAYVGLMGSGGLLVSAIVAGAVAARILTRGKDETKPVPDPALAIMTATLCAMPAAIFLFALLVTHTFNDRYVVAGALGLAMLLAIGVSRLPHAGLVSAALIATAGVSFVAAQFAEGADDVRTEAIAAVEAAPQGLPIVTGNGLRFFELSEGAKPAVAHRLVYLTSPSGVISPDPTNEHQVQRWANIRGDLAVIDAAGFVARNPRFLVFSDPSAVDVLPDWLAAKHIPVRWREIGSDGIRIGSVGDPAP